MRQGGAGGVGRPPAKIFEVYNPKRCIFKAFFPFFSSLFLSLFYFFSLTLLFHFFSPALHSPPPPPSPFFFFFPNPSISFYFPSQPFPPPPYHSILENIYPCKRFNQNEGEKNRKSRDILGVLIIVGSYYPFQKFF